MGALIGLVFGCGALLIWRSGTRRLPRLRPRGPLFERRRELLRQAGLHDVGPVQLFVLQLVSGVAVAAPVLVLTASTSFTLCFGGFGAVAPVLIVRGLRRRRRTVLREHWPDAIDDLASAVRAGLPLAEALGGLAVRAPAELRPHFESFASAYRANGRFDDCLLRLKAELADPVGDRVCETVRLARDVGGSDLGTVLRTLSELLRADLRARSELATRQGWVVNAARLAVAAPWIVLLLLGSHAGTAGAFESAMGRVVLLGGAGVCGVAYRLMVRIGRLPDEIRVLR